MKNVLSLKNSLDLVAVVIAIAAALAVLQTFIIGKHYLIPTMILFWGVLFGNLARFGLLGFAWAKHILFWVFFVFTVHLFFAFFFSAKYRELLGSVFEVIIAVLFIVFAFLVVTYARRNAVFRGSTT